MFVSINHKHTFTSQLMSKHEISYGSSAKSEMIPMKCTMKFIHDYYCMSVLCHEITQEISCHYWEALKSLLIHLVRCFKIVCSYTVGQKCATKSICLNQEKCTPWRGIEPRSPMWQTRILTTILPRTCTLVKDFCYYCIILLTPVMVSGTFQ